VFAGFQGGKLLYLLYFSNLFKDTPQLNRAQVICGSSTGCRSASLFSAVMSDHLDRVWQWHIHFHPGFFVFKMMMRIKQKKPVSENKTTPVDSLMKH